MCCCCCPPAITALFCLWVRNGFSKACVAGALTFFPQNPPLYKFQRVSKDGKNLSDSVHDTDEDDEKEEESDLELQEESDAVKSNNGKSSTASSSNRKNDTSESEGPRSAIAALSERQQVLNRQAKLKYRVDKLDAKNGVTYKFIVPPSLCPARFAPYIERMEALKLYNSKAKSYIATVIYRAPPKSSFLVSGYNTSTTKTILYSHGNATDAGGMSFLQCYLARSLNVNIVMYDYSGYGESG